MTNSDNLTGDRPAEYRLEIDQTWPSIEGSGVGVKDGAIVPVEHLDDPEVIHFDGDYTVLTAGWTNAHAHLELSGARGIEYDGDFVDWIYDVLEFKLDQDTSQMEEAFREGCRRLVESGVCRVFDHCDRTEWLMSAAADVALDARLLKELIAFLPEQIEDTMDEAEQFLSDLEEAGLEGGLAPHAPYSAHPRLYEQAWELTQQRESVFSTHLHETQQEMDFVLDDGGRFQDLLEDRTGDRHPSPYEGRPLSDLIGRGLYRHSGLAVHLNYIDEDDLRWLERSRCYPVFCPRSYQYFRHNAKPAQKFVNRDIPFCLGTDSRASNDGIDMLAELRTLSEVIPDVSPDTVLSALTVHPARVMGEPDRGELTFGTPADFSIFNVPGQSTEALARGEAEALAVLVDGEVTWRR